MKATDQPQIVTSASSGLVLVDKPAGLTSQQAVVRTRKMLAVERAGHTGTLDPFATGLLLVLLGRATRLAVFVQDEPKEYEALIRFGVETESDDATGAPVRTAPLPRDAAIADAIAHLTGDIEQTPPSFSAKHIDGKRAYRLARKGVATELRPVRVRVDSWQVLARTADCVRARVICAGGTYIRALARDLGRLTNSAAHCAELRRVRCGTFTVTDAVLPDAVRPEHVRPALAAVAGLPTQPVDAGQALGVAHGRPAGATVAGQWAALVRDDTELLAVAERRGDEWHPRVVLCDA
ncbi:MAG: tRNA pseudouridine(55) synthase TruB [Gemmatimonadaceae bacterium]